MPDLRPVRRYMEQLTRVEAGLVRSARRRWDDARGELVDVLSRPGTPDLSIVTRRAGYDLARSWSDMSPRIAELAASLVAAQTGRTLPLLPLAPAAALWTSGWEAAALGLLLTELLRLRTSGADTRAILDRLITGRDGRVSVHQLAGNALQLAAESAVWSAGNAHVAALAGELGPYQKQAIAAVDSRTTDCCLAVHGQIQPLDQPFRLSGTPRHADRVMNPPFHHRCRTATSLYLPAMEAIGTPTSAMRQAAAAAERSRSSVPATR